MLGRGAQLAWGGGSYVRWSDPFRALGNGGWAAVLVFFVALTVLTQNLPQLAASWETFRDEVSVQAKVERVWQRPAHQPCVDACTVYGVDYSFSAGQTLRNSATVEPNLWATLKPGSALDIWYRRGNPEQQRLQHSPQFWGDLAAVALGLVCCIFGALGLVLGMIGFGRAIVLRETGTRRTAQITRLRSMGRTGWFAYWTDGTGEKGYLFRGWRRNLPPLGATITIYADPASKWRSVWEGDCGAREGGFPWASAAASARFAKQFG